MASGAPAHRLQSIDFLRGVAALAVAFGHALIAAPYTDVGQPWFEQVCLAIKWLSGTGVPLFFVISGFCIHLGQTRHEGLNAFSFAAFWKRRIWRLYPTYLVVLAGSIGLLFVMLVTGNGEATLARYAEPRWRTIALDGVWHVFMLHGLHPIYDQGAGNPPLWTLAREEYLYLMYPAILLLRHRLGWQAFALLLAALTVAIELSAPLFVTPVLASWLATSAPALWIQWYLGSVAADAYRGRVQVPTVFRQVWWVPLWLAAGYALPFSTIWLALAYFTLVNACVGVEAEGRWPRTSAAAAITGVGLWSYSLYLIHHPVQTVGLAVTLRLLPGDGVGLFVTRALLLMAVSCVAGRVLFGLVERHFVAPRRTGA